MTASYIQETLALMTEAFQSFYKRLWSAALQIVLYSILVLVLFSLAFGKPLAWDQILAFTWGSIITSLGTLGALRMVPGSLQALLLEGNTKKTTLHTAFAAGMKMASILILTLAFGLWTCYFLMPNTLIGFGLGATLSVFFLRLGGNLYKSTSDIGADVIATLEKDIPHFDKRNPLTLLDLSGEFIGRVAGFGSDLALSLVFAIIACIMFASVSAQSHLLSPENAHKLAQLPLIILANGIIASTIAYLACRWRLKTKNTTNFLLEGVYIAAVCCGISTWITTYWMDLHIPMSAIGGYAEQFHPFLAYAMGLIGAVLFGFGSEYLTSHHYPPARDLAAQAEFGPTITLLSAIAKGKKSQGLFLASLLIVTLPAIYFAGLYGIALAALGMLSVTAMILATTFFSALASNAVKIATLTESDDALHKKMHQLDKVGGTTIALGNGFAAGASVLVTIALLFSITNHVHVASLFHNSLLWIGIVIGISTPAMFSGFLLSGLGNAIKATITEMLRQFREIPYLKEGKAKPDMIKAADATARTAMDALILPGILMILVPMAVRYIWGLEMLSGVVLGTLLIGFGTCFTNSITGGILYNTKHYIRHGAFGGKESPGFQSVIIADNIGESFNHLISPSMTIAMRGVMIVALYLMVISS